MGLDFEYDYGQTELNEDEREGILIKSIVNHRELNEAEQLNIEEAIEWTLRRKFTANDILSEPFCRDLHRRMYNHVWRWAGEYRKSNKNIGVEKYEIAVALKQLIDDVKFWITNNIFEEDEIAVRFKHRIVSIHCFPNGNGRHSRLIADVIVNHIFGKKVFSWGSKSYDLKGEARREYLNALKQADKGDFRGLMTFSRG